jgi:hypothetical protein
MAGVLLTYFDKISLFEIFYSFGSQSLNISSSACDYFQNG